MNNKIIDILKKVIASLLVIVILISFWQIVEDNVNQIREENKETSLEYFIPSPKSIMYSFVADFNIIQNAILSTLIKAIPGFIVGVFLAILMAILYIIIPSFRNATFGIAYALNSFPLVGLAPIIILMFGQGSFLSIMFVVMLVSYFPMLITLDGALNQTPREYIELMKINKATKFKTLIYARIPLAMPQFFVSLRLSIPSSIVGAIIGEWMGASEGIGRLMILSVYQMEAGRLYACMFAVAIICATTAILIEYISRKVLFWNNTK